MPGITPNRGSTATPIRHNRLDHWRHRLIRISKPPTGNGVKKKISLTETILKQKRHVSTSAYYYGYRMKKFMIRNLDKVMPKGLRDPSIRWVPLNTPLSRRLETLAIFIGIFFGAIMPVLSYVILYYVLYSRLWWLGLMYIFYIFHDQDVASNGGRRWNAYRNMKLFRYAAQYFPIKLVKTVDLDPTQNYIAPTCPHGQIMVGALGCFCTNATGFTEKFPGIKSYLGMDPGCFKAPFLRDLILFGGGVSASKDSLTSLMDKRHQGNFLALNLGGSEEVMESRHDVYKVFVKNRKGYARIAIKTGASVVPVFCFGETRTFDTEPYPEGTLMRRLQDKVREITGISPIAVRGRGFFQYNFGMIAFRTPITVVVGEPIEVQQNLKPTNEEVDDLHNKYMEKLIKLFDTHKHTYEPDPTIQLVLM